MALFNLSSEYEANCTPNYFNTVQNAVGKSSLGIFQNLRNPGYFDEIISGEAAFCYSPSRFGLSEISPGLASAAQRIDNDLVLMGAVSGMSSKLYNDLDYIFNSSYRLGKYLKVGIGLEYLHTNFRDFGSLGLFIINCSATLELQENLSAGLVINNLLRNHVDENDITTSQLAIIGVGYEPAKGLNIDFDFAINLNYSTRFGLSMNYTDWQYVVPRLAFCSNPDVIECGLSLNPINSIGLTSSMSYHSYLGFCQVFGLSLFW